MAVCVLGIAAIAALGNARAPGGSAQATAPVTPASLLLLTFSGLAGVLGARWAAARPAPVSPAHASPPPGLGPVQVAYLADAPTWHGWRGLAGSLMKAEQDGLLRVTQTAPSTFEIVRLLAPGTVRSDPVTSAVLTHLGLDECESTFELSADADLTPDGTHLHLSETITWAVDSGVLDLGRRPDLGRWLWVATSATTCVGLVALCAVAGDLPALALLPALMPAAAYTIGAAPGLALPRADGRFTLAGREMAGAARAYAADVKARLAAGTLPTRELAYALPLGLVDHAFDPPPGRDRRKRPAQLAASYSSGEAGWGALVRDLARFQAPSGDGVSGGGGGGGGW